MVWKWLNFFKGFNFTYLFLLMTCFSLWQQWASPFKAFLHLFMSFWYFYFYQLLGRCIYSPSHHRTSMAQGIFKVGPDTGPKPTYVCQNPKIPSAPLAPPKGSPQTPGNKQRQLVVFGEPFHLWAVLPVLPRNWRVPPASGGHLPGFWPLLRDNFITWGTPNKGNADVAESIFGNAGHVWALPSTRTNLKTALCHIRTVVGKMI